MKTTTKIIIGVEKKIEVSQKKLNSSAYYTTVTTRRGQIKKYSVGLNL